MELLELMFGAHGHGGRLVQPLAHGRLLGSIRVDQYLGRAVRGARASGIAPLQHDVLEVQFRAVRGPMKHLEHRTSEAKMLQ